MAELTNEFSWSRSRDNAFQECKRKYFYHYYGAWGGWDAAAPQEVRRLYILKQLASRQQWAGRAVHDAIEMALHAFAHGRDIPVEPFIADVIERMRGEWRSSKAGRYRENPKSTALFEHEYRVELAPEAWQALSRNVGACLRNFFRLPLLAEIRKTTPEHWSIEHWSKVFDFESTAVWVAPDFGFWTGQGRLALVDWKTGGTSPNGAAFQLGCYALYAHDVLGVEPARGPLRGEPARARGDADPLERRAARGDSRAAPPLDPVDEGLSGGSGGERRGRRRLREDRGPSDLSLVQLPRGLPARARRLTGRRVT